jgi:hypothetical protein
MKVLVRSTHSCSRSRMSLYRAAFSHSIACGSRALKSGGIVSDGSNCVIKKFGDVFEVERLCSRRHAGRKGQICLVVLGLSRLIDGT